VHVFLRSTYGGRRFIVGLLLAVALFFNTVGTLFAGTTGTINGTVTDADSKLPLSGVTVNAVSPTGRYVGSTDARGFFAFNGVSPDTYTVSFELKGFQPQTITGINVFADQSVSASTTLQKSLVTIGKVTARAQGGAFQPNQTQDTYTVTQKQITELLGKSDSVSETNLLTRLPGASLDKYGYPVLRGGRENEEGFQFDGIDYVDAFTSQFTNSLALNPSVGQLQLTPGAGDASVGNAGTGTINLVAKRGAYPGFGSLDAEALLQPYTHQFAFEYGFATPNGAISNYISFLGSNTDSQFGARGTPAASLSTGTFYDPSLNTSRDIVDNFVVKFGKNQNQSFQILYDNQQSNFFGLYGGLDNQFYPTGSNFFLTEAEGLGYVGLNTAQLQSTQFVSLLPFQKSLTQPLEGGATKYYQPNNVIKFQYTNNLSSSTFLTAKYYQLDSVVNFDFPYDDNSLIFASFDALQGGHRTGAAIDLSSQLNDKNLLTFGGKYDFLHPVYNQIDPLDGIVATSGNNAGFEVADFINPNNPNPNLGSCPLGTDPNGASYCGYLFSQGLANPGPIPYNSEQTVSNRQDYAFYLRDKFTPNDKLNIDAGIRFDGAHYQLPGLTGCNPTNATQALDDSCQYYPSGFKNGLPFVNVTNDQKSPLIAEPRLSIAYNLSKNDAVRASYGRSVEFAPLAFVDVTDPLGNYSRYANIPSYDVLANFNAGTPVNYAGYPAMFCGVTGNLPCKNYADQLHWENQNFLQGVPIQPVKPETFTNYEFSYQHQFPNNIGFKVTPFYRRGYDALVLVAQPRINPATGQQALDANGNLQFGPPTATNLGISRTTGVEAYLTREVAYGLSGQLSATYINEFTNVVPSPLIQEDFFPPVPTQSLALGNQYRVGFISPFTASLGLSYKSKGGLRVNPIVTYTRGYPIGVGNVTAAYVGGNPVNIPNTNTNEAAAFGTNLAPNFVDPQNPGTLFKPNIAATRGTPESASAGGVLQAARFNTNLGIEFNKPGSKATFGVLITNLFNQIYGRTPTYNARYQPVATGISGPKTGYSGLPLAFPNNGFQQYLPSQFGQDPYRLIPNATPQTIRLYYQLAL
jgi:hypothetical protein